ncbi:MAG: guanylate kinase [Alphaproteobacteria bacterium]|nr:guanylate kinase [Alphaproteobacteria bacterium]
MTEPSIVRRGLMLVLSSPSGAGKTTISRKLLDLEPDLVMSVSATTRPRRPSEVDGVDYRFIDDVAFDEMVKRDAFLEHAEVFGHRYGTPRALVEQVLGKGRDMLFDIDWQGTRQIAARMRDDLITVFVLPPSKAELERRLRARQQDSDAVVQGRMAKANAEMAHWDEYDYVVVNADVQDSVATVRAILAAERRRRVRQTGLAGFVARLTDGA